MARLSDLRGARLALDTSVFIYALEDHPEFGTRAAALFRAVERGSVAAVASDLALAELIVRPLRMGQEDVADRYLATLPSFPNLTFRAATRAVLVLAARVRARSGLGLADCLHVASAIDAGARAFVTNDLRLARADVGVEAVLLKDLETDPEDSL